MKFCISYFGPEPIFHLRRDFILAMQYGLESLGHDVVLTGREIDLTRFNLVVGAYFLAREDLLRLSQIKVGLAHVNTEVISQDMLNFSPAKTDFLGAYLPALRAGHCIWEAVVDNLPEHERYGNRAHFLRWGWHPKLEDITHRIDKDLDFYFFGLMSDRRRAVVGALQQRGLVGIADHTCPYFLRNDRISRARVHLNIVQDEKYSHVNAFRICYLANNRCAIVSESESDPANYLEVARVVRKDDIADAVLELSRGGGWKDFGEDAYERFRRTPMTRCLEELLDHSFGAESGRALAGAAR